MPNSQQLPCFLIIFYIQSLPNRNTFFTCSKLKELEKEGFGAVELCGAFGPEKAQQLIELTHNKIAIGYVVHNPEQNQLFDAFFGH